MHLGIFAADLCTAYSHFILGMTYPHYSLLLSAESAFGEFHWNFCWAKNSSGIHSTGIFPLECIPLEFGVPLVFEVHERASESKRSESEEEEEEDQE